MFWKASSSSSCNEMCRRQETKEQFDISPRLFQLRKEAFTTGTAGLWGQAASTGVWLATVHRLWGQLCRAAAFGPVPRDSSCHKQTALKATGPVPSSFQDGCSVPADLRPAHSIKFKWILTAPWRDGEEIQKQVEREWGRSGCRNFIFPGLLCCWINWEGKKKKYIFTLKFTGTLNWLMKWDSWRTFSSTSIRLQKISESVKKKDLLSLKSWVRLHAWHF